jgi:hypothetical protein
MRWTVPELLALPRSVYDELIALLREEQAASMRTF